MFQFLDERGQQNVYKVLHDGFETSLIKTMSLASENQITLVVEQLFGHVFWRKDFRDTSSTTHLSSGSEVSSIPYDSNVKKIEAAFASQVLLSCLQTASVRSLPR